MKFFIGICLSLIAFTASAQKKGLNIGIIKDSVTQEIITFTSITNLNNSKTVISNKAGLFYLNVDENSLLSFAAVTVYSNKKYNAYQMDSIQRRTEFFTGKSDYAIPTFSNGNSGTGIGLNLDHFYNREKRKKKVITLFEQMEQEQYINYRYTPQFVNEFTQLTDDALSEFMQQSRPSYSWLRKHTEKEDLIYYINDQLKLFDKKN